MNVIEVEDLQGVTGLKALRVNVLYNFGAEENKEYYTWDDLMKELDA